MTSQPQTRKEKIESVAPVRDYNWIGWTPILILPLTAVSCRNLILPWAFMWTLWVPSSSVSSG